MLFSRHSQNTVNTSSGQYDPYGPYGHLRAAEEMPRIAEHLLKLLQLQKPEFVVVCDRNARPIGKAVEYFAEITDQPLPTKDGVLHYRKVTHKVPFATFSAHMSGLFDYFAEQSVMPRVTVIDDHMSSGMTRHAFRKSFTHRFPVGSFEWTCLTEKGAHNDISRFVDSSSRGWCDRADVIGIDYDTGLNPIDTTSTRSDEFYAAIRENTLQYLGNKALK